MGSVTTCAVFVYAAASLVDRPVARWVHAHLGDERLLSAPPPRKSRFGGPLALSKVHWVKPELVAEINFLGWTDEPLLRHTVFIGLREDKLAGEVRRETLTT